MAKAIGDGIAQRMQAGMARRAEQALEDVVGEVTGKATEAGLPLGPLEPAGGDESPRPRRRG
jgi:hypothetical protein